MGWTIFLIVMTVLAVILLLPARLKASFGDGKWSVSVYYCFFRIFRKESAEKPKPETPPLPDLNADEPPVYEPVQPSAQPVKPEPLPKPEPVQTTEPAPKPEQIPLQAPASMPEHQAEPAADTAPEKPKKKGRIRRFFERMKPHSLSDVMGLVKDGGASLSASMRFLLRHFHFRKVKLYLAVASDDAYKTSQLYGKICTGAFNLLGQLQCLLDLQVKEFRILADFFNEKTTFRGSLELRVSPAAALLTALILGCKFLVRTIRRFRREDKEAKRREKESAPLPAAGA